MHQTCSKNRGARWVLERGQSQLLLVRADEMQVGPFSIAGRYRSMVFLERDLERGFSRIVDDPHTDVERPKVADPCLLGL